METMKKYWISGLLCMTALVLPASENTWPGDGSFETSADFFELPRDTAEHFDGKYSLKIAPGKLGISFRTFMTKEANHKGYISFYLKADRPCQFSTDSVTDKWGNHFNKVCQASKEWQHYVFELPADNYTGGCDIRICPRDKESTLWVDAVSYHADAAPEKFVPHKYETGVSAPEGVGAVQHISNKPVVHTIAAKNNTQESGKFTLSATLESGSSPVPVQLYSKNIELKAGELFEDRMTVLKKADRGYYVIRTKLTKDNQTVAAHDQPFCVLDEALPVREDSMAGLYFTQDGYGRNIGAAWSRHINISRNVGADGSIPDTKEGFLAPKTKYGFMQCNILAHHSSVEKNTAWVLAADKVCGTDMKYWSIGGEVDLTWPNNPKLYSDMVNDAVPKLRAQHPGVRIAGLGVSGVDFNSGYAFAEPVIAAVKNNLDIVAPHPYTWQHYVDDTNSDIGPEGAQTYERVLQLREILTANGSKAEIWFGEVGWAPDVRADFLSETNRRAASYIPRLFVLGRAAGVKRIFYFLIHFQVDKECYNYGLWRSGKPLPGTAAYSAVAQALEFTTLSKIVANKDYHAMTFKREDGKMLACLWMSNRDKAKITMKLPKGAEVRDMFWNPVSVPDGKWTLSGEMSYLLVPGISEEEFNKTVAEAKVDMPPVKAEWKLDTGNSVIITLTNLRTEPVTGTFTVSGAAFKRGTRQINLKESASASYRLGAAESLNGRKLSLKVKTNAGEMEDGYYPLVYECPVWTADQFNAQQMPKTGRLPDMMDRKYLLPNDPGNGWDGPENLSVKSAIGHDAQNLYLRIDVTDSVHIQSRKPGQLWAEDSIQLAIDSKGNAILNQGYDKDDYEFGFGLSNGKSAKELTYTYDMGRFDKILDAAKVKIKREGNTTRYWIIIPLKAIKINSAKGSIIGLNFCALDNDGQGVRYWMGPTPGICAGKNPGAFRKFILK